MDNSQFQDVIGALDGYYVGRGKRPNKSEFEARATALELLTGDELPADYRAFVRACGCCALSAVAAVRGERLPVSIFFGFENGQAYDLAWNFKNFAGRIGRGQLPIAIDDGGDLFLLDLQTGAISAWSHETENARQIALSFAAFLSMLESDGDE